MGDLASYPLKILSVLDQIPRCVKSATVIGLATNQCRADIACLCRNDEFLSMLVKAILTNCNASDQKKALGLAQGLCSDTIPSLNDTRSSEVVAIVIVMMFASALCVALRLIARKVSAVKFGPDDTMIVIALILALGLNVTELVGVRFGYGKHQIMLTLDQMESFLKASWASQILFACAITTTRLSLLFFYHRIFPMKRFTIVACMTGIIVLLWWVGFFLTVIFSCYPVNGYWDKSVTAKCANEATISFAITGAELGTNVLMLILPIPWLWDLHLPTPKKIALGGIFLLGSFVCVACIVRFPLLVQWRETDTSWTVVPTGIWIIVECNLGIASVCLPIMRPLFTKHYSHPVRSRFSAFSYSNFSFSKVSSKASQRITEEEDGTVHTTGDLNLGSKTPSIAISKPLRSGSSAGNSTSASEEPVQWGRRLEGWRSFEERTRNAIKPLPPGPKFLDSSLSAHEPPSNRRKEYWEIVEERERADQLAQVQCGKPQPSVSEQAINARNHINRNDPLAPGKQYRRRDIQLSSPRQNSTWSVSSPRMSWYRRWGHQLGPGDGNQGWELELAPTEKDNAHPGRW